jgi:DNA-binding MarR family transcriptional regulator
MKMESASDSPGERRRLTAAIKQSLRALSIQLSLLNHRVGARVDLRDVDLDCLDLIVRYHPLTPSMLAKRAALHPATLTGVIDRLERAGWLAREADPADRRAVVLRPLRGRNAELVRLYSGMGSRMDEVCQRYGDKELELLADFLGRTAEAGKEATDDLKGD